MEGVSCYLSLIHGFTIAHILSIVSAFPALGFEQWTIWMHWIKLCIFYLSPKLLEDEGKADYSPPTHLPLSAFPFQQEQNPKISKNMLKLKQYLGFKPKTNVNPRIHLFIVSFFSEMFHFSRNFNENLIFQDVWRRRSFYQHNCRLPLKIVEKNDTLFQTCLPHQNHSCMNGTKLTEIEICYAVPCSNWKTIDKLQFLVLLSKNPYIQTTYLHPNTD